MSNARNGATKLARTISVTDSGAIGDGVADDRAAIAAAIIRAGTLAPCRLVFPKGVYRCASALGSFNVSDVEIDLGGSVLDFSSVGISPGVTFLEIAGTYSGTPVLLTSNAVEGQKVVAAPSASFAVGDVVRLYSTSIYDPARTASKFGELNSIETIPGGASVTVTADLAGTYNTAAAGAIQKLTPCYRVTIHNGKLQGPAGNDSHIGIRIVLGVDVRIQNVRSFDMDAIHVQLVDCMRTTVTGCHFEESNANTTGYGTSFVDASQDCQAVGNTYNNVRHSLSTNNSASGYGVVRRILFGHNVVTDSAEALGGGGGDAIDTHAACEDVTITGNIVNASSGGGINVEGRNCIITNNFVSNTQGNGITHQNYTGKIGESTITGNVVRLVFGNYGIAVIPNAFKIDSATVSANNVRSPTVGIYMVGASGLEFNNVAVSANSVVNTFGNTAVQIDFALGGAVSANAITAQAVGVQLTSCSGVSVTGNGITLQAASGTTGYGVRLQGTGETCVVTGNALRHTGGLTAAAAVSFVNTTITYSGCYANTGRGFTAGTIFSVGTGTGNLAANNIT